MDTVHGKERYDTIVVGAGMAGLAAAYDLKKAGQRVVVLEKDEHIGGRVFTERVDDFSYDVGTQLITEYYQHTFKIVKELNISDQVERFGNLLYLGYKGTFKILSLDSFFGKSYPPWLAPKDRLLGFKVIKDVIANRKRISFQDIEKSADFDLKTIKQYADERLTPGLLEKFIAPLLATVYFMEPTEISFPLYLAIIKNFLSSNLYTFNQGVQTLPNALAKQFEVVTKQKVDQLLYEQGEWIAIVSKADGKKHYWRAKNIVLATLAHQAVSLLPKEYPITPRQRQFLAKQQYSTTSILITGYDLRMQTKAYSFMIPPYQNIGISAICLEHEKHDQHAPQGMGVHAINLHGYFAKEILCLPEHEKKKVILKEAEKIFPRYRQHVTWSKLYDIVNAMPYSYINKAREVVEFQQEQYQNRNHGLVFCGDYLNWPSVEGAIIVGQKAAQMLIEKNQQQ